MEFIQNLTTQEKVFLLKELYHDVAGMGRDGDTMLAHINPQEALLLKQRGGSGTINPVTGLPEYKKAVKTIATVAAVATIGAGFAGVGPLAGALSTTAAGGVVSSTVGAIHTGIAGIPASTGLLGTIASVGSAIKEYGSVLGLGVQAVGGYQQQQAQKSMAQAISQQNAEASKAEAARQAYQERALRLSKLQTIRTARIQQGQIAAATGQGGLGSVGTSVVSGSIGAVGTQAGANLGEINVAEGVSREISGYTQAGIAAGTKAAQASQSASMWSSVADLGSWMRTPTSPGGPTGLESAYTTATNAYTSIFG